MAHLLWRMFESSGSIGNYLFLKAVEQWEQADYTTPRCTTLRNPVKQITLERNLHEHCSHPRGGFEVY
jgi:hypothetical protein